MVHPHKSSIHPDTSTITEQVKPSRHGRQATEGIPVKGGKKQDAKEGKSQKVKEKLKIMAWELDDGSSIRIEMREWKLIRF